MRKKRVVVRPGDIIGVRLEEGKVAVGIVLHVSGLFKDAIMIGFYDRLFDSIEDIDVESLGGGFIETPNYTGRQLVTSGRWKIVGNSPTMLAAAHVPELRVVYTLYCKDQVIRQLALDEFKEYAELAGQGGLFIEDKLRRHFAEKQ